MHKKDTSQGAQRLRLQRWATGFCTQLIGLLLYLFGQWLGVINTPAWVTWQLAISLIACCGLCLYLLLSQKNLRFSDPGLTEQQILLGILWSSQFYFFLPTLRGEVLAVFLPFLFFGAYYFNHWQYARVSLFAFAINAAAVGVSSYLYGNADLRLELYRLVLFAALLTAISIIGSRLSAVRRALRRSQRELEQSNQRIRQQSQLDELTHTFNRRHLDEQLNVLQQKFALHNQVFSVVMLDLDHFKQINDQHGHLVGDDVLKQFAAFVKRHLRESDSTSNLSSLARFGGEEFVLLLPKTTEEQALQCANRLLEALQQGALSIEPNTLELSFSAGVAQIESNEAAEQLLLRADLALYQAKQQGRQRCIAASSLTCKA